MNRERASRGLATLVDSFAGLHVAVVGDAVLDRYLEGTATRLCREAAAPVVRLEGETGAPGGAANTAANASALGARATLVSVLGSDEAGGNLRRALEAAGVDCRGVVVDRNRRTLVFNRVLASSQLLVRFDAGTDSPLAADCERAVCHRLDAVVPEADVVIVSDYGYGQITQALVDKLAALQASSPRVLVVDSKHPAALRRLHPTAVKPNWSEALQLLGRGELDGTSERADGIAAHGERILELTGARIAAVTLDAEGAIVFERGRPPHRTYSRPAHVSRSTGAGDTFVAAFGLALAAGASTPAAAEVASAAAAVVVGRDGTERCSASDLRRVLATEGKILAGDALARVVEGYRREGRRIVFTNGCFDILHRGHITYLNRAKNLGDVLVVAVNDDASVRGLKGPSRPINPLEDRVEVLAALSCVDHIATFSEPSPVYLLEAVRPDVYVKGGDYTLESLPEVSVVRSLGGRVELLPFMEDRSTTGIIERIQARQGAAAEASRT